MRFRRGGKKILNEIEKDHICDCGEVTYKRTVFCRKCYNRELRRNKKIIGDNRRILRFMPAD